MLGSVNLHSFHTGTRELRVKRNNILNSKIYSKYPYLCYVILHLCHSGSGCERMSMATKTSNKQVQRAERGL